MNTPDINTMITCVAKCITYAEIRKLEFPTLHVNEHEWEVSHKAIVSHLGKVRFTPKQHPASGAPAIEYKLRNFRMFLVVGEI